MHFPPMLNMFTHCYVIKNLVRRYLLQRHVTRYQFYIFAAFIVTEMEEFVVVFLCRYI